jgi:hypothetical protein
MDFLRNIFKNGGLNKKEQMKMTVEIEKDLSEIKEEKGMTERLEILNYCIDKEINSVIYEYSSADELINFRRCITKQLNIKNHILKDVHEANMKKLNLPTKTKSSQKSISSKILEQKILDYEKFLSSKLPSQLKPN